jgi:hypothetical protein
LVSNITIDPWILIGCWTLWHMSVISVLGRLRQ